MRHLAEGRPRPFRDLFENPRVALLFTVPGVAETLRVMGTAILGRDDDLRERVPLRGRPAKVVIGVTVESAYLWMW
ncbi:MAG TPA: hypothetical protein VNT32_05460 [Thermoleophilaceae bacterium]|nr:hypothetical protein [Thermoleophilaceae bacterium]